MQLKYLKFSNMFSYGRDNFISFEGNKVTLIEGAIGAGKSSIPTILEELLYNKNSRDFKKSDILNRFCQDNFYSGTVEFSIGADNYKLTKEVKSTAKVVLLENGIDISGNTATASYKLLENIIGLDFTSFSKLVYQSVKSQMDFLSSTDAKRKEFLVGLMNLDIYKNIEEAIKLDKKELDTQINILTGEVRSLSSLLVKETRTELQELPLPTGELIDVSESILELAEKKAINRDAKKRIDEIKLRISNTTKQIQVYNNKVAQAKLLIGDKKLTQPSPFDSEKLQSVTRDLTQMQTLLSEAKKQYDHFRKDAQHTSCDVCGSTLNKEESYSAALAARDRYNSIKPKVDSLIEEKTKLVELKLLNEEYLKWRNNVLALQQLESDDSIDVLNKQLESDHKLLELESDDSLDTTELELKISNIQAQNTKYEAEIRRVELFNASVSPTNASIRSNIKKYNSTAEKLDKLKAEVLILNTESIELTTLQKSIKELVSYRIESEIKIFESYINEYLTQLSSGKFALAFSLDNAKLCVIIYNNGVETSINTLSSGETTLVNLSTLFAIRKIMTATNDLNVVFLDEIVSVLGVYDKDNLVNLLLEQDWNTFVVSHGYSNPLCSNILVKKNKQDISRIIV